MKLCLIFSIATNYREAIYRLIDSSFDCCWFFGENRTDIKSMDLHLLKDVSVGKNIKILRSFYWLKGTLRIANMGDIRTYLVLGDPFCLSTWVLLLKVRLFCPSKHIYVWTHGWYGRETFIKKVFKKFFFKMADGIFLYGNYAKNLMIQEGFDKKKLFVIHNSLNYKKQLSLRNILKTENIYQEHFNNNHPNLIFIGRLTAIKKLDLLIEAMFILKKKGEHLNLTLIGSGTEKNVLEKLALKKGLIDNIWFYGSCYDEEQNARLIFNADLCVSPGNVGLTAIHSLMFGTPVATHNSFAYQMPEFEAVKEGETGTLFNKDDANSIAISISNWFLQKGTQRQQIRTACYQEIDSEWTPEFQIEILKKNIVF